MDITGTFDPARVVADLEELATRTGGPDGSRRLAWTPTWLEARALLRESVATLPVEVEQDEAGNIWICAASAPRWSWWDHTSIRCPRAAGSTARSV